jgi:tetrahydromethanopterin S-methyltransferase subunit D
MDRNISAGLRTTFLVHTVITLVFGAALWLVPGRFLTLVGWVQESFIIDGTEITAPGTLFVDGVITRLLGSVLLALAFSSFQSWRTQEWVKVALVVQLEAVFCILSVIAGLVVVLFLRETPLPPFGWIMLVLLAAFGAAWVLALRRHE